MDLIDLADVAGAGAVVRLDSLTTRSTARVVQFVVSGAGTGSVRVGHPSTVTADRGLPLSSGGAQFLPYVGNLDWWTVPALALYIPTGYTVSIALGI